MFNFNNRFYATSVVFYISNIYQRWCRHSVRTREDCRCSRRVQQGVWQRRRERENRHPSPQPWGYKTGSSLCPGVLRSAPSPCTSLCWTFPLHPPAGTALLHSFLHLRPLPPLQQVRRDWTVLEARLAQWFSACFKFVKSQVQTPGRSNKSCLYKKFGSVTTGCWYLLWPFLGNRCS